MRKNLRGLFRVRGFACFVAAALVFSLSSGAQAQKDKKSKKSDASDQVTPPPTPDSDQIDRNIGEMLAALQLGNTEMMHKYYADNATWVRSTFEPPVIGWQNYAALYNQQKAAFQGMQLIRRNTFVFTHGDVAWASYQWEFESMLNGKPYSIQGQTTLVFTKVGGNWLIVHNHTSEVLPEATQQTAAQQQPQQTPAPPQQ
ncbi:MAG: nuclear transport factor 2 family protein [Candidatus Acidiferrales bacterium]|jgi:ketosteroid isomerase-like protein